MGTLKVNGNISATGDISASSFLGNASSATYTLQWKVTADNPCTASTDSNTGIFNVPDSRIYWISKTDTVIDQLSQWGFILDIGFNAERHQIWMTQSSGDMAHRGGNSSGWSGSWRILLDSINYTSYTVTKTGSGASGTWGINISGNSNTVGGYQASSFLLKAGDTMTGNLTAPTYIATQKMIISGTGLVDLTAAGTTRLYADGIAISNPSTKNDDAWIRVTGTGEKDTVLEIATGDDGGGTADTGPEQIVVRQYGANGLAHQITLMDTSGNTSTSGTITASSFIGNLSGNASSATNADTVDGYHASSLFKIGPWWYSENSYNANNLINSTIFAYSHHNVPYAGTVVDFSNSYNTNYRLQINAAYNSNLIAFRSRNGDNGTWQEWTSFITSANYTSYCAPASHSHNYATLGAPNNLMHSGNEFTFAPAGYNGGVWFNYRTAGWETNGNISLYMFGNGKGGYAPIEHLYDVTHNYGSGVPGTGTPGYGSAGAIYYKI